MKVTRKQPQDHRPPPSLRLGSVEDCAAENDVNPRTIRRRIADGTIPGYRVGRLVKVDLDTARDALLVPMNDAARRSLAEAGGAVA